MWKVERTPEFIRSCEEHEISQEVIEAIETWAATVQRVVTNKQKRYFCSPNNIFEIWTARIPDPDSNRGSSGGFRLVYFFIVNDGSVQLDKMERRQDLGGKNERPRDQQRFTSDLEDLKSYLLRTLDNDKPAR